MQGINQIISSVSSLKTQVDNLGKSNGFNNLNKQINQVSGLQKVANAFQKTFNFGALYIGAKKVVSSFNEMTKASVDFTETQNLFEVSLGRTIDQYGNLDEEASKYYTKAIAFNEKLEEKLGINIEESMKYQALFNNMSKSMGVGADSAYTLSENLTKLGYDLSSLYNIDTDKAMEKLKSGVISGQTKPLRDLGIDVTQATLQTDLDSLNIDRKISSLSQAEKVILRYISVLRQASSAQGDLARTMDSPANQLRIFDAQVTAFKRNMGNLWQSFLGGILPYINAIMMVINELLKMVAKLFGFETYEQPTTNISASIGADDLANDLGNATKKAKELKAQLMGFDEINNITLEDNSGGGGSAGGGASGGGIDQRLLDALKGYDNMMDSLSSKAAEIRDKMMEWLGFHRNDKGGWELNDGLTNLEKILDVVKTIGVAFLTWKVSSTITNLLKNLGILNKTQAFRWAFGLTLLATGIFAQYKGTRHLLDGDVDIFTLLETFLGTTAGAFGIVSILRSFKDSTGENLISLGNAIKIGIGITLAIQGVQVMLDGIETGDVKKTVLGALELTGALSVALSGLFGKSLITSIKDAVSGMKNFNSAINLSTGAVGKHSIATIGASSSIGNFVKKAGTMVAGLAGITAGSALTYATMKDFTTGEIEAGEAALKLTAGLGTATLSGAAAGSQFGTLGTIVGGVAGLTTSAVTAFMGYKDGIESLNIPTTTLTDEIKSLTEEIDNNRKAHEDSIKSINDTKESQLVEAEYANKLSQQLNGLVDANGRVKAGNEERVSFILGELSNALGEEYELNGNLITKNGEVVNSYGDLQNSIKETIEAKKKEAEQTAIVEKYKESIKEQIQLERDKAKAQEEFAKAEIEYNNLMAKGLSDWTLTHDENCKQIIQNYIDTADTLNNTRDEYWKVSDDVNYYSQQMTDSMIENSGKLSQEMINQQQISSDALQNMLANNTKAWEDNYNNFDTATQATMLAQSTAIDNWSPVLQQKWTDMANKSATDFEKGISSVEPNVQAQILSSITTTGDLTPEMRDAWNNLASRSKEDFSKALESLPEDTRILIETITNTTSSLSPDQIQKWADLAKNDKNAYENNLTGLDDTTRQRVQSCVDAVNNKQWTAEEASRGLADAVERGVNTIDTTEAGKQAVNGVATGINNNKNSKGLWDSLKGLKDTVVNGLKGMLGIHSPSTVLRDLVGKYIPLGVAEGIDSSTYEAVNSIKKMSQSLSKEAENATTEIYKNIGDLDINPQDFAIDANQFIDYGQISGAIATQGNISLDSDISEKVYEAVIKGMQNAKIEVEARADEGVIFKKVQVKAKEYTMQTGEPAFDF